MNPPTWQEIAEALEALASELDEARMLQAMAEDRAALADAAVGEYERVLAERDRLLDVWRKAAHLCSHGPAGTLVAFDLDANARWVVERDSRWAALHAALDAYRAATPDAEPAPGGEQ